MSSTPGPARSPTRAVGIYLAAVQFLFALGWVTYATYLPQLADQAGIGRAAVSRLLMLDQAIFLVADLAMGVAADRIATTVGRIGRWVAGVTLISCLAFLLLPLVAPLASPALFLVVTGVWAVTSSALRAPPLALIGRHAARPSRPALVALSALGSGLAGAFAPYLGMLLRDADPRLPFAISSIVLALAVGGIVAAERALAGSARHEPGASPARLGIARAAPVLLMVLLAALAFQGHAFLNSAGFFQRLADPARLPYLLPLFWVAFNVGLWPATVATRLEGGLPVMAVGAVCAAGGALLAVEAQGLGLLVCGQLLAGSGWAAILASAFSDALQDGPADLRGTLCGMISSVLALAALARIAVVASGHTAAPGLAEALAWWPALGWLLAAGGTALIGRARRARSV